MNHVNSVSKKAEMGKELLIGKFVVIEDDVKIGDNVVIGNNVSIYQDTIIGSGVTIKDGAKIGASPHKTKVSATTKAEVLPPLEIKTGSTIGYNSVIYRGSIIGKNVYIADLASVRENVEIGDNTIIGKGSTIENRVRVGKNCKIQSNVQLVPYSVVEDHVFLSPGVMTSNDNYVGRTKKRLKEFKGVTIKKGARLGVACVTLPGIVIGEDALVGGGSVVTKDVPTKKIAYGVPAKIIKDVPNEQLLENQT